MSMSFSGKDSDLMLGFLLTLPPVQTLSISDMIRARVCIGLQTLFVRRYSDFRSETSWHSEPPKTTVSIGFQSGGPARLSRKQMVKGSKFQKRLLSARKWIFLHEFSAEETVPFI